MKRNHFIWLAIAAISFLTVPACASGIHSEFCLGGICPAPPAGDRIITHRVMLLAYNDGRQASDMVAYKVTGKSIGENCERKWHKDPEIPNKNALSPEDFRHAYAKLATDRGHQAPLASLCGLPGGQDTNILSNITPQKAQLNRWAWKYLEEAVRSAVQDHGVKEVYVLTGPIWDRTTEGLPTKPNVKIPSAYWKIVQIIRNGQVERVAFLMRQNMEPTDDFCSTKTDVSAVEKLAGIKLPNQYSINVNNSNDLLNILGCRK